MAQAIQTIKPRRFIRHPLCLPLTYKVIDHGPDGNIGIRQSQTINVSMGGLLFSAKHPINAGAEILIKMPFEDNVVNIKASVVRSQSNDDTKLYDIAVDFPQPQEAFKVKMIEQLYLIMEYRDLLNLEEDKEVSLQEASRRWVKRYSQKFSKIYW